MLQSCSAVGKKGADGQQAAGKKRRQQEGKQQAQPGKRPRTDAAGPAAAGAAAPDHAVPMEADQAAPESGMWQEPKVHIYLLAAMRGCHSGCLQHDGQTLLPQVRRRRRQQQQSQAVQQPLHQQRHSQVLPGMAAGPRRRAAGTSRRLLSATSTATPLTRSCRGSWPSAAPSRGCATSGIPPAPQRCALSRTYTIYGMPWTWKLFVGRPSVGRLLHVSVVRVVGVATGKQGLQTDCSSCCGWPLKVTVCAAGLCIRGLYGSAVADGGNCEIRHRTPRPAAQHPRVTAAEGTVKMVKHVCCSTPALGSPSSKLGGPAGRLVY